MQVPLLNPDQKQQQIERQEQMIQQLLFDTTRFIYGKLIAKHGVDPLNPASVLQMCKTAEFSKVAATVLLKEFGLTKDESNEEVS